MSLYYNTTTMLAFESAANATIRCRGQELETASDLQGYKLVRISDGCEVARIERTSAGLATTYLDDKGNARTCDAAGVAIVVDCTN